MASSSQSRLRAILTVVSSVLLCLMVYINVRAMSHDMSNDVGRHGGFLRMLEQSVDYSSSSLGDGSGGGGGGGVAVAGGAGGDRRRRRAADSDGLALTDDEGGGDKMDKLGGELGELEGRFNALQGQLEKGDRIVRLGGEFDELEGKFDAMQDQLKSLLGKSKQRAKGGGGVGSSSAGSNANAGEKTMAEENREESTQQQQQQRQKQNQTQQQQNQRQQLPEKNLTGLNILLLYADDWTHSTLSAFHKTRPLNTVLKTPVLDALAADGVRFTHNCVTTSVCWISRATLYTGQYMSRHKTKEPCCWSGIKKPTKKLDEAPANWKELSFYEILAENGYHVGHAGKWGVYLPFDKNVHFSVEDDGWHYRKIGKKVWHITEKNEADALRFLVTRDRTKPFFLNVAFYATHAKDGDVRQYMPQNSSMDWYKDDTIPIPPTATQDAWEKLPYFFDDRNEGRARWRWRYDNYTKHQMMMKNYYRMATEVDAACGAILEELRRQDALDNTVIIFTTDNGNYHSEHGLADKWYPHQESIRVPLIIRDPRMSDDKRGTTNDELTLNIDLAPTILGFAGVPTPEKMMGRDMTPLYLSPEEEEPTTTTTEWRKEFFYEHPVISHKEYIPSSEALVRKDYKYMYWPDWGYEQLFDLEKDPGELEDIFNSTDPHVASVKKDMKKRFDWLKSLVKSDGVVKV